MPFVTAIRDRRIPSKCFHAYGGDWVKRSGSALRLIPGFLVPLLLSSCGYFAPSDSDALTALVNMPDPNWNMTTSDWIAGALFATPGNPNIQVRTAAAQQLNSCKSYRDDSDRHDCRAKIAANAPWKMQEKECRRVSGKNYMCKMTFGLKSEAGTQIIFAGFSYSDDGWHAQIASSWEG